MEENQPLKRPGEGEKLGRTCCRQARRTNKRGRAWRRRRRASPETDTDAHAHADADANADAEALAWPWGFSVARPRAGPSRFPPLGLAFVHASRSPGRDRHSSPVFAPTHRPDLPQVCLFRFVHTGGSPLALCYRLASSIRLDFAVTPCPARPCTPPDLPTSPVTHGALLARSHDALLRLFPLAILPS